ncbi:MAG TPA: hypothetical protein VF092_03855 [Longimicrobium sp.]
MKKKLRLQVEELRVEQFQTDPAVGAARGTVRGHDSGLSDADTEPCRFCPDMPITYSCDFSPCG